MFDLAEVLPEARAAWGCSPVRLLPDLVDPVKQPDEFVLVPGGTLGVRLLYPGTARGEVLDHTREFLAGVSVRLLGDVFEFYEIQRSSHGRDFCETETRAVLCGELMELVGGFTGGDSPVAVRADGLDDGLVRVAFC